ncbi:EF hand domain containing protein [Nitzschia inconspicua]|uniref:EF hand domain containing protein n=1 Tax=Nitzschia inconspicua TaxID=303405 RepID=A0A9K3PES0_9STRA|nr:EF hand domain containing protein [Nitzschia inconspicua]
MSTTEPDDTDQQQKKQKDTTKSSTTTETSTTTSSSWKTNNNIISNLLTRSKPFQIIVQKAFHDMDYQRNGHVDKLELYTGVLMVHLKLAKYAGPAACYPPTKQVCDQLFDAADVDNSGFINQQEFSSILRVLCAQILFRMAVYYIILILLVPFVAAKVVATMGIPNGSYLAMAAEQSISLATFLGAIPTIWNLIDERASQKIGQLAQQQQQQQQQQSQQQQETDTKPNKSSNTDKKEK